MGRHGGEDHRFEGVAFDRVVEAEVGQAQHVAVAVSQRNGFVFAGGGVIHRRDVDRQVEDEGVAGAVRAQHTHLLDAVEVRQVGHIDDKGVLVDRGEEAGRSNRDPFGAVENVERDAGGLNGAVVGIGLLEQVIQLKGLTRVLAKSDACSVTRNCHERPPFFCFWFRRAPTKPRRVEKIELTTAICGPLRRN